MASMPERFHPFETADTANSALADRVCQVLQDAIHSRGRAILIASGGSTPDRLYRVLAQRDIGWANIDVVLADERWVARGEEGSNADFVSASLLTGKAANARLTELKYSARSPQDSLAEAERHLAALPWPADCAILGMGEDGHTLSWFPHAEGLEAALSSDGQLAAAITALPSPVTGTLTQRITLTRRALEGVGLCALLIRGEAKRAALERARLPGPPAEMPVRALLNDARLQVDVFWSP